MKELPITQQELQMMKVLSVLFLRGPRAKRIHYIYEDILHKFDCAKPFEKVGIIDEDDATENTNLPVEVVVVGNEPEEQNFNIFRLGMFQKVPLNKFELNISHEIIKRGKPFNQIIYIDYLNECNRKGIHDRTFNAFRAALLRAKKSKE